MPDSKVILEIPTDHLGTCASATDYQLVADNQHCTILEGSVDQYSHKKWLKQKSKGISNLNVTSSADDVEGYIAPLSILVPRDYPREALHPRFSHLPMWNRSSPPIKLPDSPLLSSVDNELWTEFSQAVTQNLKLEIRVFFLLWLFPFVFWSLFLVGAERPWWGYLAMMLFIAVATYLQAIRMAVLCQPFSGRLQKTVFIYRNRFAESNIHVDLLKTQVGTIRPKIFRYIIFTSLVNKNRSSLMNIS